MNNLLSNNRNFINVQLKVNKNKIIVTNKLSLISVGKVEKALSR